MKKFASAILTAGTMALSNPAQAEQIQSKEVGVLVEKSSENAMKTIETKEISEKEKLNNYRKELKKIDEDFLKIFKEEDYINFKQNKNSHFEPPYELYKKYIDDFREKTENLRERFKKEEFKELSSESAKVEGEIMENRVFVLVFDFLLKNKPKKIDTGINTEKLRKVLLIGQIHLADDMTSQDVGDMGESQLLIRNFLKYFQKDNIEVGVEGIEVGNDERWNREYIVMSIFNYIAFFNLESTLTEKDFEEINEEVQKIESIENMNPFNIHIQGIGFTFSWVSEENLYEFMKYKKIIEKLEKEGIPLSKILETSNGVANYMHEGGKLSIRGIEYGGWGEETQDGDIKIKNMNAIDFHEAIFSEKGIIFVYFFDYIEGLIKNGKVDGEEKEYLEKILKHKDKFHLDGDYLVKILGEEEFLNHMGGFMGSQTFKEFKEDVKTIDELGGENLTNREIKENLEKFIKKYPIENKELEETFRKLVINMTDEQSLKRETNAIDSMSQVDKSQKVLPFVMGYGHMRNFEDTAKNWNKNPENEKFDFEYLDLSSFGLKLEDLTDEEVVYE